MKETKSYGHSRATPYEVQSKGQPEAADNLTKRPRGRPRKFPKERDDAGEDARHSVTAQSTFEEIGNPTELRNKLRETAEELEKALLRENFRGRVIFLKVKLDHDKVIRRRIIPDSIYLANDLYRFSEPLLSKLEQ
jgi:hypothetical protein